MLVNPSSPYTPEQNPVEFLAFPHLSSPSATSSRHGEILKKDLEPICIIPPDCMFLLCSIENQIVQMGREKEIPIWWENLEPRRTTVRILVRSHDPEPGLAILN